MKSRFFLVVAFLLCGFSGVWAQRTLWGTASSGAADNKGVIFKINEDGTGYTVMHNFITDFPGAAPQGSLTLAGGKLYGMTSSGGANNVGIIFEYDPVNNIYINKHDFVDINGAYPLGGLVRASNGLLYGTTTYGGVSGLGVLFEFDPATNAFTKKFDFSGSDGANPQGNLTQASNTKLYGLASGGASSAGVIFEYDISLGVYAKKADFSGSDGNSPYGDLVEASGKLYGMTAAGGAIGKGVLFEYVPGATSFTKMIDFTGTNGTSPNGSLLLASNSKLYGLASAGGANGQGILFEYVAGAATLTKKIDFNSSVNGAQPLGTLFQAGNGLLYGTTSSGGANGDGSLFEYDLASTLTKKADFSLNSGGGNPQGRLVEANGLLYGLTPAGPGITGTGTLYSYDPTSGSLQTTLSFSNAINGSAPTDGLVQASNGMLYGMTSIGGSTAQGIIYQFDPIGNTYTRKADFDFISTGANPQGALVLANGKFYGITPSGGASGDGTLFEYDFVSNGLVKKFDFAVASSGGNAQGSLVLANGLLYGMTQLGGPSGHGVLFSFDPATSTFTSQYSFASTSGGYGPNGSLLLAANGKLYGTTNQGGANSKGVVFEFDIATGSYTKKADFDTNNGASPSGDLMQASNGKLYGMTQNGGASSAGVIYEFDPIAGSLTLKYEFDGPTYGSDPLGNLTEGAPGKLYGTTSSGGSSGRGVLFQFDVPTVSPVNMVNFGGANGEKPYYGSLLLVPGKTAQTISFSALPGKLATDGPFTLVATATSALPITFTSSDPSIASIAGNTVTIHQLGTVIISASQYGNSTYGYALDVQQPLVISKTDQTITFNAIPGKTYGGSSFFLSASATSTLPVTFSSGDPTIAGVSPTGTVTILKAGTVQITASQSGNSSYNAAPDVVQPLVIAKKDQSIFFTTIPAKTFGDGPITLSAVSDSGLPVIFDIPTPPADPGVVSLSANTATILKAGVTPIRATQAGNVNYNTALPVVNNLTVNQAPQVITLALNATVAYGTAPYTLPATADSGLPLTYSSSNAGIASISGNTVTINGVSDPATINITANQAGNGNYLPASKIQVLLVTKGNQTITFPAIPSKGTLDAPFTLAATSSSGLTVTYASSNLGVATVSGNTVTIVGAGTSTITASQAGDIHYIAATAVDQTLTVIPKQSQTITFNTLPSRNFGDAPFTLSATSSSGLAVVFASSDLTTATVSGNTVTILKAGSVTITASQPGDANYLAASDVPQTLTIGKGSQAITFGTLPGVATTDPAFTLSATASSGLPVTYTSSNLLVATVSGNTVTPVGAGTTTITANQSGDANYFAAPAVGQPLTVIVKQSQTIAFGVLLPKAMGDLPFQLSASATSALPVSFTSGNTSIATISGTTLTIVGVGTVSINATQAGNGSFLPASPVSQNLVVQKGNQTISFTAPTSPTEGGPSVTLLGTSSSGLALSYLAITTDKITVSGTTATPLKAGLATVRAQQGGDASYNAATPVDQTFCIKPAKPLISVTNATSNSPTLTSSSAAGNIWLLNGTPVTGAVNQTHTVIKAGTYTVIVTIEGCLSDPSAPQTILITGDLPLVTGEVNVYPNPTKDKLYVDLTSFQSGPVDLRILDLAGKSVHQQRTAGGTIVEVNVADQVPAVYILVASQGSKVMQAKYMKQ